MTANWQIKCQLADFREKLIIFSENFDFLFNKPTMFCWHTIKANL